MQNRDKKEREIILVGVQGLGKVISAQTMIDDNTKIVAVDFPPDRRETIYIQPMPQLAEPFMNPEDYPKGARAHNRSQNQRNARKRAKNSKKARKKNRK